MSVDPSNRRRVLRIELSTPLVAKIGNKKVILHDLSGHGARIEHTFALARGNRITLDFEYRDGRLSVPCEVVRCKVEKHDGNISYYSGLLFVDTGDGAIAAFRKIIADMVGRDFEARQSHVAGTED